MNTILLFGATGKQGGAIAKKLQEKGNIVISPVRSEKNIAVLQERNIAAFLTDFSPNSLVPIINRADKVVLQIPAQISPSEMIALAEQCLQGIKQAGSLPTVFSISSTVPEKPTGLASPDARYKMRKMAHKFLPEATILSATEYLENFSESYRQAIEGGGIIPQSIPEHLPVNYLSWADLATYIEAVLSNADLKGRFLQIGGKEGINGTTLAKRLGNILDKDLHYQELTLTELTGILTPIVGAQLASELAEFYGWQHSENHLLNPDTTEIRNMLGIELPSFEEWAREAFGINQKTT